MVGVVVTGGVVALGVVGGTVTTTGGWVAGGAGGLVALDVGCGVDVLPDEPTGTEVDPFVSTTTCLLLGTDCALSEHCWSMRSNSAAPTKSPPSLTATTR